jgi:magnesium transporter
MLTPKLKMLEQTIKRLTRRGASGPLEKVLAKTHVADLGFLLGRFGRADRLHLIKHCGDDDRRAEVVAEAELQVAAEVIDALSPRAAVGLLERMEPDDVSDILECLDEAKGDELLQLMRGSDRTEVEELSRYDSSSAGGIMSPRFFALNRDTTARQAIEALQGLQSELEMVFYVYVINELDQLLGVLSLRQLVINKADKRLFDLMTSDVISVRPDVHQEEVARLASRYGLLAIPVVDETNKLVGIVTVDDVIDVLREEATEDILRMAGAGGELAVEQSLLRSVGTRLPWVILTAVAGAIGGVLISAFDDVLAQQQVALYLIPVVLGLAGIMGLQSSTVIGQRLAKGSFGGDIVKQLLSQFGIGVVLGLALGALVAVFAWAVWLQLRADLLLPAVYCGTAVSVAVITSSFLGAALPLLFVRIRIDPALASGPLVAVMGDLVGLVLYLALCRAMSTTPGF